MYKEVEFKGTRADFIAFLEAFVDKKYFPGFGSHCPYFSTHYPGEEPVNDETKRVKVSFGLNHNTHPTIITASKLANNNTMLTAKVLHGRTRTILNINDPSISFDWDILVSEMQKHGWIEEETSKIREDKIDKSLIIRTNLMRKIEKHFSQDELTEICFLLGIDPDNFEAKNKKGRVIELIRLVERTGRVHKLTEIVKKQRPEMPWNDKLS